MNRRDTIAALLALGVTPLSVRAQRAEKVHRVALLFFSAPASSMAGTEPAHPLAKAFVHELRALGYVEGRNLSIDRYSLEGNRGRATAVVAEALRRAPDVIVCSTNVLTLAAKRATQTIPIVMAGNVIPVKAGVVASLAHPGGNVTGLTFDVSGETESKRLELLKEAVPKILRVAFVGNDYVWKTMGATHLHAVAVALNLELYHAATKGNDVAAAFPIISRKGADAMFVAADVGTYTGRRQIVEYAAENRIPASYAHRESVNDGGLMAYAVSAVNLYRRTADYVGKILEGSKPGDLPVERPSKYELVLNLRTAKALGIMMPQSILLRADRVIE